MHRTEIPIAKPCDADWSTMTLAERGRFCGECRKVVHELSALTEPAARALLASPPTEGLCVRYIYDARGEIVFRRDIIPVARLAKRAIATALAVAMPFAPMACMGPPRANTGEPPVMPMATDPAPRPSSKPPAQTPQTPSPDAVAPAKPPEPVMGGI